MRHVFARAIVVGSWLAIAACGPGGRHSGGGGGGSVDADSSGMENTPATCSDGVDNDGDGLVDCADPSCSGIGMCPVCGMVEHPTGTPVDLPDGVGGNTCTTDADCAAIQPGPQHCYDILDGTGTKECRQSYTSKVHFSGFGPTQTLAQTSDIVSVCVVISHDWVRDLEIDLVAPSGQKLALDKYAGRDIADEEWLGHPADSDGDCAACTPEMGLQYCFTPTATKQPLLPYCNAGGPFDSWAGGMVIPPDNYQASDPWTNLVGATLNGDWEIQITDLWEMDAGKLHSWTIAFNPAIVQNCSGPVIQ